MRLLAVLAVAATLLACAALNPQKHLQPWVGHTEAELLRQWGPPTNTYSDGAGGKIVEYVIDRTYETTTPDTRREVINGTVYPNGQVVATGRTVGQAPTTSRQGWIVTRQFYVRADGTIYGVRAKGL